MSTLFNKLTISSAPKVWADADFEAIFNDPKCYDFWKALGREQTTWAAWSSFLERTKLQVDYTTTKSPWFKWVYHHKRNGYPLKTLHLAPVVEKQCSEFITFYEAQLAKEARQRQLEEEERIKVWQKRKKQINAETDPNRVAYRLVIPAEELSLYLDRKKEVKDLKRIIEEVPFDTWKAQIEERYIYEKNGTPEGRVVDIVVECTNYGLTYTPEDIQAVKEGKKKVEQCKPIVKEYPCPVITVNEEAKKKTLEQMNAKGSGRSVVRPQLYERSGDGPRPANEVQKSARDYMKRPKPEGSAQPETPPSQK
jgi:hypothetical protein